MDENNPSNVTPIKQKPSLSELLKESLKTGAYKFDSEKQEFNFSIKLDDIAKIESHELNSISIDKIHNMIINSEIFKNEEDVFKIKEFKISTVVNPEQSIPFNFDAKTKEKNEDSFLNNIVNNEQNPKDSTKPNLNPKRTYGDTDGSDVMLAAGAGIGNFTRGLVSMPGKVLKSARVGVEGLKDAAFRGSQAVQENIDQWRQVQPESTLRLAREAKDKFLAAAEKFYAHPAVAQAITEIGNSDDYKPLGKLLITNPEVKAIWQQANDAGNSAISSLTKASKVNARANIDITEESDSIIDLIKEKGRKLPSKFNMDGTIRSTLSERMDAIADKIAKVIQKILSKFGVNKNPKMGMNQQ